MMVQRLGMQESLGGKRGGRPFGWLDGLPGDARLGEVPVLEGRHVRGDAQAEVRIAGVDSQDEVDARLIREGVDILDDAAGVVGALDKDLVALLEAAEIARDGKVPRVGREALDGGAREDGSTLRTGVGQLA